MSLPVTRADPVILRRRIRVARGLEPGDLLLKGAQVVNVFTQRLQKADVVIADGFVAGVGPYRWEAATEILVAGAVVLPSLIDAHIHLESTLLLPGELARVVVPHGTGTVVTDPHEIANVMGIQGVGLLVAQSRGLPLDLYFMAPSCVPAVSWEHAGASLDAAAIDELLQIPGVLGLAEMMNFPGVLEGDDDVLEKIATAAARRAVIDGHAPGVTGRDLLAYAAAGIRSDHESTEITEARAKAALGMLLQVREGSIARNLDTLTPLLLEEGEGGGGGGGGIGDWCLCTDDIHPDDLAANGHLDALLRRLVTAGVPPERAIRHTTLVPARHYGLADRGAVSPGYRADLVVADDLTEFGVSLVIKNGRVVARGGQYLGETAPCEIRPDNTVHLPALDESAFEVSAGLPDGGAASPVIGIVEDQVITRHLSRPVNRSDDGLWSFDADVDVAVIASIERHRASGSIGLGLVEGFGFRRHGALGSSVAHDSHNLIIAGTNPADMLLCARALAETGGGFVVAAGGVIAGRLPLPVAGLLSMSDADTVCRQLIEVRQAARALGSQLPCPFGTLSFLALSVIPELRITDQGLFDVVNQRFL